MVNEFSIAVLCKLIDELTKPMQKMGLAVQNQGKKISEFGDKFVNVGEKMAKLTAPLAIIGGLAIKNFGEADEALAKLENSIRIAGKQGSISATGLAEFATKLQSLTNIEDEVTESSMAMMIQMTKLNEGQIKEITPLLQDWSKAMGVDLNTSTQQFIRMMSGSSQGLGRYQIGVNKSMGASQRFAVAVDYLNKHVKGTAETMAGRGLGTLESLKIAFGELTEDIGKYILPEFNKIIKVVKGWVESFGKLDDGTKKMIITLGLIAVAIGPVMMGIGGLIKTVGMLVGAFGFLMAHPVILGLVAIAAAVTGIVIAVNAFNNRFNDAKTKIDENRGKVEKLSTRYNELQAKVNKTNAEYHEMSSLQAQLIAINPGFAASINKTTGELDLSAKHLKEYNNELDRNKMLIIDQQLKEATKAYGQAVKDIDDVAKNKWMAPDVKKGIIQEAIERKKNADLKMKELIVEKDSIKGKKDETKATADLTNALADANDESAKELYLKNAILRSGELAVDKEIKANVAGAIKKTGSVDVTVRVASDKGSSAIIQKVSKQGDINTNIITDSYLGLAGI